VGACTLRTVIRSQEEPRDIKDDYRMRTCELICLMALLIAHSQATRAQVDASGAEKGNSFGLKLSVDEVNLTFHAADANGMPVNDLKLEEFGILDDGRTPRRVVRFQLLEDAPIRGGILMDTSESMTDHVARDRAISIKYVEHMLGQKADKGFLMEFGYTSNVMTPWTSDSAVLASGIRNVAADKQNLLGGTALFDALFRACFSEFSKVDHATSGNFILLFSDGQDNTSRTSLREAVDMCQRSDTAVYVFRSTAGTQLFSSGPKTLRELAEQTGGRVFNADDSDAYIDSDLGIIESELRNLYRVIYNPAELKHNGMFHRIELETPERVATISVRSGYYAPDR
jgi:Ca-activated chloride channel homolog